MNCFLLHITYHRSGTICSADDGIVIAVFAVINKPFDIAFVFRNIFYSFQYAFPIADIFTFGRVYFLFTGSIIREDDSGKTLLIYEFKKSFFISYGMRKQKVSAKYLSFFRYADKTFYFFFT